MLIFLHICRIPCKSSYRMAGIIIGGTYVISGNEGDVNELP